MSWCPMRGHKSLTGTVTVTDGFDDVVGQAMVNLTERGD